MLETGDLYLHLYLFPLQKHFTVLLYFWSEIKAWKIFPSKEVMSFPVINKIQWAIYETFFSPKLLVVLEYALKVEKLLISTNQVLPPHVLACYCKVERLVAVGSTYTFLSSTSMDSSWLLNISDLSSHLDCKPFGQGAPCCLVVTCILSCVMLFVACKFVKWCAIWRLIV